MRWVIVSLILFICFASIAHAENSSDTIAKAGADMVKSGIDAWLVSSADEMIGFADNMSTTASPKPERDSSEMMLFNLITVDYDPFQNPGVIAVLQQTSIIFLFMFILFVFGGMMYVMIHSKFPHTGEALDFALHMEKGFDYKEYIKTLGSVVLFLIFGFTAVWTVLLISHVISEMMTISALDATVASPNSAVIYFFMAIAYLLLSVFIAIRLLVISIITALLMVLFALWAFHIIRDVITVIFVYFATMIFLQPILISVAAIGIMTIEWIVKAGVWPQGAFALYLGLILILLITAFIFTIGPVTVQKLIRVGIRKVLV